MAKTYLIDVDLGTSATKAAHYDTNGRLDQREARAAFALAEKRTSLKVVIQPKQERN